MAIRPLQYTEVERARIQQQLKALQDAVAAGGGGGGGPVAWGSITGTLSAQADLQTALNGKAGTIHGHVISDVSGLQTALDGKQAAGSYAAATHGHIIADVAGLQTALDGKQAAGSYAAASHAHIVGDVTGLQAALDGKAAATHSHAIADVTGLQTALDGKQATIPGGTVTVTVPAYSVAWTETVAAAGVTPSSTIIPALAPHLDTDENDAELLSIVALSALAGTNQITFTLAFAEPTAGPIKLNWRA